MTYIKINGTEYPAKISGRRRDGDWDGRESKSITLKLDYALAASLFVSGADWSILQELDAVDETGQARTALEEYDNSEFTVPGDITDHRDGTVTVKMGKLTDLEAAYEMMFGGARAC